MKLQKFKEEKKNQKSIILFTITCVLLITGVFLYKTFAVFQTNLNEDIINGEVQDIGDLEFAFYIDDGKVDQISKTAPKKDDGYSLDTSSSYCKDMTTGEKVSRINWDNERWGPYLSNITTTKTKCYLHFKKIYEEDTLNGAIPDLMNGRLIPVVISEEEKPSDVTYSNTDNKVGGKVSKADITNTSNPWYSYKDKKWANAVILRDGKEDNYLPGEEIEEKDIESYFVWIPRYSYKLQEEESTFDSYSGVTLLGNKTNVTEVYEEMKKTNGVGNKATNHPFEIEFGSREKGVNTTLLSKGTSIVHPAFEAFDSNGFWVGKFETGYNQNEDISSVMPATSSGWSVQGAEHNTQESTKVIIKPSVYSWRSIQVANAFYTSYNYKRELESHMMKNTEWGAVAYLTQSQYGRCTDSICSDIRINNVASYITGSSAKNVPTCGYTETNETCNKYETIDKLYIDGDYSNNYYNQASKESSTTGNYSGVYDMNGGAAEYVMGVMQGKDDNSKTPASGKNKDSNSGFKGPYSYCTANGGEEDCKDNTSNTTGKEWPSRKYYDLYDHKIKDTEYQRGYLGDATKEVGPFYNVAFIKPSDQMPGIKRYVSSYNANVAFFVCAVGPWFVRGGAYNNGTIAGVMAFVSNHGSQLSHYGFRTILTP